MHTCDCIIIGAGIAGTSCGYWLSRERSIVVLEMEAQPGYHTTGRSVAVYTEAYGPRTIRALAKSGFGFLTNPPDGFSPVPLSRPQGLFFIARHDQLASLERALAGVRELSPDIAMITPADAVDQVPVLRKDYLGGAFLDPNALALDVNAIHHGYIQGMKQNGGRLICDAEVTQLTNEHGLWRAVTGQGTFAAPVIVNAAGAWADHMAELAGVPTIGLQPKRRTVIAFVPANTPVRDDWPVVIDTDEEFYFKVDAGTVLGSPADETPVPAQDVQPEELDIAYTIDRLERATVMKIDRLQRRWAGLRSFVADHVPVVGYASGVEGFFWCAGQGGYGIETSVALGRTASALIQNEGLPHEICALDVTAGDLAPDRFLQSITTDNPA